MHSLAWFGLFCFIGSFIRCWFFPGNWNSTSHFNIVTSGVLFLNLRFGFVVEQEVAHFGSTSLRDRTSFANKQVMGLIQAPGIILGALEPVKSKQNLLKSHVSGLLNVFRHSIHGSAYRAQHLLDSENKFIWHKFWTHIVISIQLETGTLQRNN